MLTLLIFLLLLLVKLLKKGLEEERTGGLVEVVEEDVQRTLKRESEGRVGEEDSAFTVYDKVDLLSPLGHAPYLLPHQKSCNFSSVKCINPIHSPAIPRNCYYRGGEPGTRDSGTVSADSLSSLLSDSHHQESVL